MFRTRMLTLLAILLCLALPVSAAQVECDAQYCFSAGDFSEDETLAGICITSLPDSDRGTILLGTRVVQRGDILTADQLNQMVFQSLSQEENQEALMTYLPIYKDRVETVATMAIQVMGKSNQAPVAEDSALETYKNLPGEAMLKARDPEGQALTFTIIRQPKRGEAAIREDGSFIYTPSKNKVGVDSFTYTATDPDGNVSRTATVTITIIKPENPSQYTDTVGKSCRFAAEWMKNTGIFVSESLGGNGCFQPDKKVSRGEFLTMLVSALDIPLEEAASVTGYSDECADWLKPYLAAAMRSGLTTGWDSGNVFQPEEPITGAEAAVMLQNALDLSFSGEAETVSADVSETVPDWAAEALSVLDRHGIRICGDADLTRGDTAQILYQASKLK